MAKLTLNNGNVLYIKARKDGNVISIDIAPDKDTLRNMPCQLGMVLPNGTFKVTGWLHSVLPAGVGLVYDDMGAIKVVTPTPTPKGRV